MNRNHFFWFLFFAFLWATCTPTLSHSFAAYDDLLFAKEDVNKPRKTSCDTNEYYAPDTLHIDHTPIKWVRINFHFMNSSDRKNNIPKDEQYKYVQDLVWVLNKSLETNMKMFIPPGNQTPALPIRYRYKLTPDPKIPGDNGVYEHIDDELYFFVKSGRNRNNTDRRVINKYEVQKDSVLNLFIMPHHPDSVASQKYRADASGIALGTTVKIGGQWIKKPDAWGVRGIFHHEMGHVLGLSHTWSSNDGCDDTPKNPNCWNYTDSHPCDTMASNNVMDYNAHQAAWTPCQLGRIFKNFAREGSRQRNILVPKWCQLQKDKDIIIDGDIHWHGATDVEGNIYINNGATLTIHCRTSIPEQGKIVVGPKGTLILENAQLHNACGKTWQGIELATAGKEKGKIIVNGTHSIENTANNFSSVD